MLSAPQCPYCDTTAELVDGLVIYPDNPKVAGKQFWYCKHDDAWCAVHSNSPTLKPVGRMANAELREAKRKLHHAFDPLWNAGFMRHVQERGNHAKKSECVRIAYEWLSTTMGMPFKQCHIGALDLDQCAKATAICNERGNELLQRY